MSDKIERINKNYYKISINPVCSCLIDEHLMKKAIKILGKYKKEMDTLLQNNPEHTINEEWSLCYPYKIQTSFYATDLKPCERRTPKFRVNKVENIFFIGNKNIYSDEVRKKIQDIIEKDTPDET